MSAIDDLFLEIEHHQLMRAHATLIMAAKTELKQFHKDAKAADEEHSKLVIVADERFILEQTLKHIANLAHFGGTLKKGTADANYILTLIRVLSTRYVDWFILHNEREELVTAAEKEALRAPKRS